ncbi:hypothetical protein [Cellulomonas denverensis]|uniref:Uncharacterized protein n=1 Tax=Cellulomonas denverensis TaxID=264297 RepID=A0A7X6KTW5_9CELL|nr:hypothetical protein [Cellulomonas denverensis]NKY22221.1 hypothetical protein [Cellulomonas denverensis]GIG27187.1 hypothetical protein Cde04nite_34310 [Cellulomonas denverensis]
MYVRVKDKDTGHEFDVPESSRLIRDGHVTRVKDERFPPAEQARPPKHHLNLAGRSTTRSAPKPSGKGESTPKEN